MGCRELKAELEMLIRWLERRRDDCAHDADDDDDPVPEVQVLIDWLEVRADHPALDEATNREFKQTAAELRELLTDALRSA